MQPWQCDVVQPERVISINCIYSQWNTPPTVDLLASLVRSQIPATRALWWFKIRQFHPLVPCSFLQSFCRNMYVADADFHFFLRLSSPQEFFCTVPFYSNLNLMICNVLYRSQSMCLSVKAAGEGVFKLLRFGRSHVSVFFNLAFFPPNSSNPFRDTLLCVHLSCDTQLSPTLRTFSRMKSLTSLFTFVAISLQPQQSRLSLLISISCVCSYRIRLCGCVDTAIQSSSVSWVHMKHGM